MTNQFLAKRFYALSIIVPLVASCASTSGSVSEEDSAAQHTASDNQGNKPTAHVQDREDTKMWDSPPWKNAEDLATFCDEALKSAQVIRQEISSNTLKPTVDGVLSRFNDMLTALDSGSGIAGRSLRSLGYPIRQYQPHVLVPCHRDQ